MQGDTENRDRRVYMDGASAMSMTFYNAQSGRLQYVLNPAQGYGCLYQYLFMCIFGPIKDKDNKIIKVRHAGTA